MGTYHFYCSDPIPLAPICFKGVAYDGLHFILLDPIHNKFHKYDRDFHAAETVDMENKYTGICYDMDESCYWAIANNNASVLYQLDSALNLVQQIRIGNAPSSMANGIQYDLSRKALWVSFSDRVAYMIKGSFVYICEKHDCVKGQPQGVLSLPFCLMIATSSMKQDFLRLLHPSGQEEGSAELPPGFRIESLCAQHPAADCPDEDIPVYLLLTQADSLASFIARCSITYEKDRKEAAVMNSYTDNGKPTPIAYEPCSCNEKGNAPCNREGCGKANCRCKDYIYCPCCRECANDPCCCQKCTSSPCCKDCMCKHCWCCPPHPHGCTCEEEICQIIHSIALEEAGISHILNAEGEKIQKAVACCNTTEELLQINESVKETITHLTQLEIQLNLKLENILRCELCRKKDCDRCQPHDC